MGEDGWGLLRGRVKALPGPLQQYEDAAVGDGDDQEQEGEDHADLMAHRRRAPGDDGPDNGGDEQRRKQRGDEQERPLIFKRQQILRLQHEAQHARHDQREPAAPRGPLAAPVGREDVVVAPEIVDLPPDEKPEQPQSPCGGDLKEVDQPKVQPERITGGRQQETDQRLKVVLLRQLRALQGHAAQNKPDDGEAGKAASGQEREETVQHGPTAQRLPRRHHDGPDDGAAKQKARRKVQARLIQRGERLVGDDLGQPEGHEAHKEKPVQKIGEPRLLAGTALQQAPPAEMGADQSVEHHKRQNDSREV